MASTALKIVLLGTTGAGKSSTGNTILGRNVFKENISPGRVTRRLQKERGQVAGRNITVFDTPGFSDTSVEEMESVIEKSMKSSSPKPHVFLLVIRLGTFTQENKNAVEWIQENFGEEALQYTMVLFTGGDQLDKSLNEFLSYSPELKDLCRRCHGGHHAFSNTERNDLTQVTELLAKVDDMVERNGGKHYTEEMYEKAQRKNWTSWIPDIFGKGAGALFLKAVEGGMPTMGGNEAGTGGKKTKP